MSTTRTFLSTAPDKRLSLSTPIQNGAIVTFHGICDHCERFFRSWDVIDAVQSFSALPGHANEPIFLCTVAHLLQACVACHLCALLLRALELFPNKEVRSRSDARVYLRPVESDDCVVLQVSLGGNTSLAHGERKDGAVFSLRRFPYSASNDAFQQHITTKQIHHLARENLHIAKSWIETCIANHLHCQNFQRNTVSPHEMPTRILEVGENSIRLRCDMTNETFDYLVLSHMWGEDDGNQLLLREHNIEEFKKDIPMQKLTTSATFQEAIRVTRALGYRYIWIDSLCIVQDSTSDWNDEASRMAIVYGNAVCNIACLFPPNNDQQPSTREDPRVWHPCILRSATTSRPGVYIEHVNRAWILTDKRYGREWLMQSKWPLFNRAWTFQEYLLSPRTLLLGHKNLMYQCTQLFYDELLGPLGSHNHHNNPSSTTPSAASETKANLDTDLCKSKYFPTSLFTVTESSDPCALVLLSFLRTWLSLINEYRARDLSFGKDRIIAIAGIARAYAHLGNLTYLAGMWRQCFPIGLLWYVAEKPSLLARAHNNIAPGVLFDYVAKVREDVVAVAADGEQEQRVPSWSFFSIPVYAFHHLALVLGDDEASAKRKSMAEQARVCLDNVFWAGLLAFRWMNLSEGQVPVGAYSNFTGLRLTLDTKVLAVSGGWLTDVLEQMRRMRKGTTCLIDRELDCSPIFKYHPDDIQNSDGELPENTVLALVGEIQIVRPAGKYNVQRCLMGLVILPAVDRGTWRRVGVWKLRLKISGVKVTSGNMGLVAERWRDYNVLPEKWTEKVITLV